MIRADLRPAARALAALAAAFAVGALFVAASGADLVVTARALAHGAFGDAYAIAETLTRATPLLLAGLAVAVAFRAGALNIGAEGQILGGASAAVAAGLCLHGAPSLLAIPAVLLAAAVGGALVAGIAAALRRWRAVPEVLSTILLNFVMVQAVSWLVRGPLQESARAYPQSDPMAASAMLPRLLGSTRLHAGTPIALAVAVLAALLLFRTAAGFRLRAVGLGPAAARFAGFFPERVVAGALVLSGAVAGLAGGVEVAGLTGRLFENLSGGIGYVAIAVALLGRLHPAGVVAAALLFGALDSGAAEMQREAGVSASLAQVIEATALAGVLGADHFARRGAAPEAPAAEEPA